MEQFLPGYEMSPKTWVYLSAFLIIAVFFRFSRLWSLRNLDLLSLLAAAPGLLLVRYGIDRPELATPEQLELASRYTLTGYIWLFALSGVYLVRLLIDPYLRRRPHLGQNLNGSGLAFLCVSAFLLLIVGAINRPLPYSVTRVMNEANGYLDGAPSSAVDSISSHGPVLPIIAAPATLLFSHYAPMCIAIASHLAVVIGLIFVGKNLFSNVQLGLSMATLYLLLPVTAIDVGAATHVIPSALIVWSILCFRSPVVSGVLMGLACGMLFFPLFLLPLWIAFYGRRKAWRFAGSLLIVGTLLLATLILTSHDPDSLIGKTIGTVQFTVLQFEGNTGTRGVWGPDNQAYRYPLMVSYAIMVILLTVWPRRKNLEHLMTSSAAVIVGTQFWYPQEGSVYLLWFFPLLLMVVFRPRLMHLTSDTDGTSREATRVQPLNPSTSSRPSTAATPRIHLFR